MKLAIMTMESYAGLLVLDEEGDAVRVPWQDMIPASWLELPLNMNVVRHFEEVPSDARAVNASGKVQVLANMLRPVHPGQSIPLMNALRGNGSLSLMTGFVWAREDVPKAIEYMVGSLPAERESAVGRKINLKGTPVERDPWVECGVGGWDADTCEGCSTEPRCRARCEARQQPGPLTPEMIEDLNKEIMEHDPHETINAYKNYNVNQNRRRAMGDGRKWSQYVGHVPTKVTLWTGTKVRVRLGDVMPTPWVGTLTAVEQAGFEEVPGEFHTMKEIDDKRCETAREYYEKGKESGIVPDGDWEKVGADEMDGLRHQANGFKQVTDDLFAADLDGHQPVAMVRDLIRQVQTLRADLRGIEDRDDGWESKKHRHDGTFMRRDQNPGVIRKHVKHGVPCDDMSGDDVCDDADRAEFACRGGPR